MKPPVPWVDWPWLEKLVNDLRYLPWGGQGKPLNRKNSKSENCLKTAPNPHHPVQDVRALS